MPEQLPRLVSDPHIRWRRHGQGGILLNISTSEVFRLNQAAMRMWSLLMEGKAAREAIGAIVAETGAEAATVTADLDGFVSSMLRAGVLRPSGPDDATEGDIKP